MPPRRTHQTLEPIQHLIANVKRKGQKVHHNLSGKRALPPLFDKLAKICFHFYFIMYHVYKCHRMSVLYGLWLTYAATLLVPKIIHSVMNNSNQTGRQEQAN